MSRLQNQSSSPRWLVSEARMIFGASQRYTLVVEGEGDFRLFRQWLVDENARIKKVDGKSRVQEVWRESQAVKVESVVCIADVDYDLIHRPAPADAERFLLVSVRSEGGANSIECNDVEASLIRSKAFLKVMSNKYRDGDLFGEGFEKRIQNLRERLRRAARNIGGFRAADRIYSLANGRSPIGAAWRSRTSTMQGA